MRVKIEFEECEHPGDLENYKQDLINCDATIVESKLDYEDETAIVIIEVEDYNRFMDNFGITTSYDFATFRQPY